MRVAHWQKKQFKTVVCSWCGYFWNFRGEIDLDKYISCPKCKKTTILKDALLEKRISKHLKDTEKFYQEQGGKVNAT